MTAADKPRFRVIAGRPVPVSDPEQETPLQRARRRFGRPFAHEQGSDYKHRPAPFVLDYWMRARGK